MPTYVITAPDGKEYEITAPEGATEQQVLEYAKANYQSAPDAAPTDTMRQRLKDLGVGAGQVAANLAGGAVRGAGSIGATLLAPVDIAARAMGVKNDFIGRADRRQAMTEQLRSMGVDPESLAFQAGKIGAEIAGTAGVGAPLAGGARMLGPRAAAIVEPLQTFGLRGKNMLLRGLGGAVTGGAAAGLVEPTSGSVKLGALFGGVLPLGVKMTESATEAARRYFRPNLLDVAEGREQAIINALRSPNVLVPGSLPTAGEAAVPAGAARFSALQRSAEDVLPSIYAERAAQQEAARQAVARGVGQTPADLKAAEAARSAQATSDYTAAFNQSLKADAQLVQLSKNPYFQDALRGARKIMKAKQLGPTDMVENIHSIKLALDDMLSPNAPTALGRSERQQVSKLKDDLIGWLEQRVPAYGAARQEFARRSVPINQMEVGQFLENELVSPLGKERAASFTRALREAPRTIKRSTGFARFQELSDVLTPEQIENLYKIRDEFVRSAEFERLVKYGQGRSAQVGKQASEKMKDTMGEIPNLLSRTASFANFILKRLQGKIDRKLAIELATKMLDPAATADLLEAEIKRRAVSNARLGPMRTVPASFGIETPADVRNQLMIMGVSAPGQISRAVMGSNALAEE
ncbi:MAG: hypothetical protein VKK05_03630 [Synechococcus sp.]|nr:hypothetical protein [Synechococcus sp.]